MIETLPTCVNEIGLYGIVSLLYRNRRLEIVQCSVMMIWRTALLSATFSTRFSMDSYVYRGYLITGKELFDALDFQYECLQAHYAARNGLFLL